MSELPRLTASEAVDRSIDLFPDAYPGQGYFIRMGRVGYSIMNDMHDLLVSSLDHDWEYFEPLVFGMFICAAISEGTYAPEWASNIRQIVGAQTNNPTDPATESLYNECPTTVKLMRAIAEYNEREGDYPVACPHGTPFSIACPKCKEIFLP